jgi:hypothetical protein
MVFGSYYHGYAVLDAVLSDQELMKRVNIVAVATDGSRHHTLQPGKSFWRYRANDKEKALPLYKTARKNIPLYYANEEISYTKEGKEEPSALPQEFCDKIRQSRPDIVYIASFNPKLTDDIIKLPPHGCFNLQPSDGLSDDKGKPLPTYTETDPFEQIIDRKSPHTRMALYPLSPAARNGARVLLTPEKSAINIPYDRFRENIPAEKMEKFLTNANTKLKAINGVYTPQQVERDFLMPAVFVSENLLARLAEGKALSEAEIEDFAQEEIKTRVKGEAVRNLYKDTAPLAGTAVNVHLRRLLGMHLTPEQLAMGYTELEQGAPGQSEATLVEKKPEEPSVIRRGINPNPAARRGRKSDETDGQEHGQGGAQR